MSPEPILYCLTRDRELAHALDSRMDGALAFFFNDAARLYQAIMLRTPNLVLVDTEAGRTVVTMTDLVERLLPSAA